MVLGAGTRPEKHTTRVLVASNPTLATKSFSFSRIRIASYANANPLPARGSRKVNDTSPEFDKMVIERYRSMTPDQRMRIASSMFETARAIIESSLPTSLTGRERRLAFAKRLYAGELPEAALVAFADWTG
jgi:hypothetical protein